MEQNLLKDEIENMLQGIAGSSPANSKTGMRKS
jgi:hypothetical protein